MVGPNEVSSEQITQYVGELLREAKGRSGVDNLGLVVKECGISNFGSMYIMYPGIRKSGVIIYKGKQDDSLFNSWANRLAYICGTCSLSDREHSIYGVGEMGFANLLQRTPKYPTQVAWDSVPPELTPKGIKSFVADQIKKSVKEKFPEDENLRELCVSLDDIVVRP